MQSYTRNHLEHDDGIYFAPIPDPRTLSEPRRYAPLRTLEYDGSEESLAKIHEILRAEAIKWT